MGQSDWVGSLGYPGPFWGETNTLFINEGETFFFLFLFFLGGGGVGKCGDFIKQIKEKHLLAMLL